MDALVFAAGRGTRLRPHTDDVPKPLLQVAGEPLLAHCLRAAVDYVDRIVLVVGYRDAEIEARFGDEFSGIPIEYARQESREGLAHAVLAAEEYVEGDVLTINGDNVFEGDLSGLVDRHHEPGVDGTVLLDRVERNEAEATARCDLAEDGTIRGIETAVGEAPEAGYIAAGAQTHDGTALLDACRSVERSKNDEYELTEALASLVEQGRYVGVEPDGWHLNVNTPADLDEARRRFAGE
ncbi:nucleotidyltransferase family protein [Halalkalicoccus tibetensis]|uniref:Nucleotidyltransferase family protein n=1 Tax=Halalkalicoccus tibetensis TaxID=175632 RepID=A0ABD5UZS9_9EURY